MILMSDFDIAVDYDSATFSVTFDSPQHMFETLVGLVMLVDSIDGCEVLGEE